MKIKSRLFIAFFGLLAFYFLFRYGFGESNLQVFLLIAWILFFSVISWCLYSFFVPGKAFFRNRHYFDGLLFALFLFGFMILKDIDDKSNLFNSSDWVALVIYLLFGWLMAYFYRNSFNDLRRKNSLEFKEGEVEELVSEAAMLIDEKWLRGILYLTNMRIVFIANVKNAEHFFEFERESIQLRRWGSIPSGLIFDQKNKVNTKYPKMWLRQVRKAEN